jgi:6-phosphogluconolactonase
VVLLKKIMKAGSLFACIAGMMLMTGCAGFFQNQYSTSTTSTGSNDGDYVYVTNSGSNTISALDISSATLSTISGSPYTLSYTPTSIVVTIPNTYVYVGTSVGVYGYSIGTNGALTALDNSIVLQACGSTGGVASLDVSPDGQWLIELAADGLTICVGQISSSAGTLTAGTPITYSVTGAIPTQIKVSPNGKFVFAALGSGGTVVFPFTTSSGSFSSSAQVLNYANTNSDSDNALAIDANTGYLYIARSGSTSPGVWVYAINSSSGALNSTNQGSTSIPYIAVTNPHSIAFNKSGTYLYAGDYTDGTLYGFTAATGQLTPTPGSPYTTGDDPAAIAYDDTSTYMVTVNTGGSPAVQLFGFDSTNAGKLYAVASGTAGTDPIAVALTH